MKITKPVGTRWRKSDLFSKEEMKIPNCVMLLPDYKNDILLSLMWRKNQKIYYNMTKLSELFIAQLIADIKIDQKISIYKACLQNLFYCIPEKYRIPLGDVNIFWCKDKERLSYFQKALDFNKIKKAPNLSFRFQLEEYFRQKANKYEGRRTL